MFKTVSIFMAIWVLLMTGACNKQKAKSETGNEKTGEKPLISEKTVMVSCEVDRENNIQISVSNQTAIPVEFLCGIDKLGEDRWVPYVSDVTHNFIPGKSYAVVLKLNPFEKNKFLWNYYAYYKNCKKNAIEMGPITGKYRGRVTIHTNDISSRDSREIFFSNVVTIKESEKPQSTNLTK